MLRHHGSFDPFDSLDSLILTGKIDNHMLDGHDPAHLPDALLRKLPLAMALIHHGWCHRNLHLPQRNRVLGLEAESGWVYEQRVVSGIQRTDRVLVFRADGVDWVLFELGICKEDLREYQG